MTQHTYDVCRLITTTVTTRVVARIRAKSRADAEKKGKALKQDRFKPAPDKAVHWPTDVRHEAVHLKGERYP